MEGYMNTMTDFAAKERERLNKEKSDIAAKRATLDEEEKSIDRELAAIAAYERVLSGQKKTQTVTARAPRGSKKEAILTLLKGTPGMTAGDIKERTGIKGDKAAEGSLGNMLTALKKAGTIVSKEGKYSLAGA